jgi:huntingtin
MELFLLCSDDAESDVRMVADECLNKVIKVRTICMVSFSVL